VIITDRDLALLAALDSSFLDTASLICIWYINQAVIKKAKSFIVKPSPMEINQTNKNDEFDKFYRDWH
jgi:hypothetical protein